MKTLCIVSCGNKKIWNKNPNAGQIKAKYVYIGPFAKKCREYTEKFYPSSWCILSAKYGFLFPNEVVPGPYNVSFNDRRTKPITTKELSAQAMEKGLNDYEQIVIIGGKNYIKMVKEVFPSKKTLVPLSECKGIGHMMGRLNEAIKGGFPL